MHSLHLSNGQVRPTPTMELAESTRLGPTASPECDITYIYDPFESYMTLQVYPSDFY